MTLDASGNLLVNANSSTSSVAKLQVFGSTTVTTNNGQLRINDSGTTTKTLSIGVDGTNNVAFLQSMQDGVAYRSLILNGLGGNVGINTTSPNCILDLGLSNLSNGTNSQFLRVNAGGYNQASSASLDLFNWSNNFDQPLGWRITSATEGTGVTVGRSLTFNTVVTDGGGGISTATPRLTIASTGAATFSSSVTALKYIANAQATYGSLTYEETFKYASSPAGIWFGNSFNSNNNVGVQLRTSNDGTSVQALTITPQGNVGINTASPGQLLTVYQDTNGDARISLTNPNTGASARTFLYAITTGNRYVGMLAYGANATGTTYGLSNASLGILEAGGDISNLLISSPTTIVFGANNSERMRITSGGAVEMTGTVKTGAPSGGTAKPWKLGQATSGGIGPTSHYVQIEIDGTVYYIGVSDTSP